MTVSREGFIHLTDVDCLPGEKSSLQKGAVHAEVDTNEAIYMEWIVDGVTMKKEQMSAASYAFDFHEEEYHWIRVDIRYLDGRLYGFTNPIYFGEEQPEWKTWNEIIQVVSRKREHNAKKVLHRAKRFM